MPIKIKTGQCARGKGFTYIWLQAVGDQTEIKLKISGGTDVIGRLVDDYKDLVVFTPIVLEGRRASTSCSYDAIAEMDGVV